MIASQKYTVEDVRQNIGRVNDPDVLFTYLLAAILTEELKATPMYIEYSDGSSAEPTCYKIVGFSAMEQHSAAIRGDRRPAHKLVAQINEPDFEHEYQRVNQNRSCDTVLYAQNIGYHREEKPAAMYSSCPMAIRRQDWTTVVRRTLDLQEFWSMCFPPSELDTQVFEPGQKVYWTRVLSMADFPTIKSFKVVSQDGLRLSERGNYAVDTLIQPMQLFHMDSDGVIAVHSRELISEEQFRKFMDNPQGNGQWVKHEDSPWFKQNVLDKMPPEVLYP